MAITMLGGEADGTGRARLHEPVDASTREVSDPAHRWQGKRWRRKRLHGKR